MLPPPPPAYWLFPSFLVRSYVLSRSAIMRPFVYKVYYTRNQVPLYLCRIKPTLKCCILSFYYFRYCRFTKVLQPMIELENLRISLKLLEDQNKAWKIPTFVELFPKPKTLLWLNHNFVVSRSLSDSNYFSVPYNVYYICILFH